MSSSHPPEGVVYDSEFTKCSMASDDCIFKTPVPIVIDLSGAEQLHQKLSADFLFAPGAQSSCLV
jgi:hypothetical protein